MGATSGVMRRAAPTDSPPEGEISATTIADALHIAARAGRWDIVELLSRVYEPLAPKR
jgi:hypothetical protein